MIHLVNSPSIFVILFLILVVACLVYLCVGYKRDKDWLLQDLRRKKTEIRSLKGYIDNKEKERKLYTFESGVNRIENVVLWKEVSQHLRLTLDDGSLCVLSIPSQYKFIIQSSQKKEPSE